MLIIFDCDGVLVDSEPIAARELQRYLEDIDYPVIVRAEDHDRFLGFTLKKMRHDLETEAATPLPVDFEDELRRRDKLAFEADLTAIPGVLETVQCLDAPYCVASSGPPEKIRTSLALTGMLDVFAPHLFSAHDPGVANGKPAPDIFLYAAAKMGFAPSACVVIEDSPAGVVAGVAAGMRVLGFTGGGHCGPGYDGLLRSAGAEVIFDDMAQLPGLITKS